MQPQLTYPQKKPYTIQTTPTEGACLHVGVVPTPSPLTLYHWRPTETPSGAIAHSLLWSHHHAAHAPTAHYTCPSCVCGWCGCGVCVVCVCVCVEGVCVGCVCVVCVCVWRVCALCVWCMGVCTCMWGGRRSYRTI